jgi:hypothetical protein
MTPAIAGHHLMSTSLTPPMLGRLGIATGACWLAGWLAGWCGCGFVPWLRLLVGVMATLRLLVGSCHVCWFASAMAAFVSAMAAGWLVPRRNGWCCPDWLVVCIVMPVCRLA